MDVVGLCNAALGLVGANAITALTDQTTNAELCTRLYPICRDEVLEAREWSFAIDRAALAADGAAPAFGYSRRFAVPSTALRVLTAGEYGLHSGVEWVREGAFLLSDQEAPLRVRLLVRVEDPGLWSPGFTMALTYRLASALATPITENRAQQDDLFALYLKELKSAALLDGMQGTPVQKPASGIASRRW